MPFIPDKQQSGFIPDKESQEAKVQQLRLGAQEAQKEAQKPIAQRFLGQLPQEAGKQLLQAPARFAASAVAAPFDIARQLGGGKPFQGKIPLLGQTFQGQAATEQQDIIQDKRPLISGLKPFAQVPLAGSEAAFYGKPIKAGAKAAVGAFKASREKSFNNFVEKLIQPVLTKSKSGTLTKAVKGGRVKEGGFLKNRTVGLDKGEKEIAEAVKTVPGIKRGQSALQSNNAIHDEIGNVAQNLRTQITQREIQPIVQREDLVSLFQSTKSAISKNPLLVGDAEESANRILNQFESFLPKNKDITAIDVLDARQALDAWMQNIKGPNIFDPKTENAVSIALRAVRSEANDLLAEKATDVAVKEMLKRQSLLYRAIENVALKAAKEKGTKVGRYLADHPLVKKLLYLGAAGAGFGIAGEAGGAIFGR